MRTGGKYTLQRGPVTRSRKPRLPSLSPCTGSRLPGLTRQGGKHTLQRPKGLPLFTQALATLYPIPPPFHLHPSTIPRCDSPISSTTSPSASRLNAVLGRYCDDPDPEVSLGPGVINNNKAHVPGSLFPLGPRSQLFLRSYSNTHTYIGLMQPHWQPPG